MARNRILCVKVSWQELKDHMRKAGPVRHADVEMTPDGRSKGYGYDKQHHSSSVLVMLVPAW